MFQSPSRLSSVDRKELAQMVHLIVIIARFKDAWEGEEAVFSEVC